VGAVGGKPEVAGSSGKPPPNRRGKKKTGSDRWEKFSKSTRRPLQAVKRETTNRRGKSQTTPIIEEGELLKRGG